MKLSFLLFVNFSVEKTKTWHYQNLISQQLLQIFLFLLFNLQQNADNKNNHKHNDMIMVNRENCNDHLLA